MSLSIDNFHCSEDGISTDPADENVILIEGYGLDTGMGVQLVSASDYSYVYVAGVTNWVNPAGTRALATASGRLAQAERASAEDKAAPAVRRGAENLTITIDPDNNPDTDDSVTADFAKVVHVDD